jgi:hypothetical protein
VPPEDPISEAVGLWILDRLADIGDPAVYYYPPEAVLWSDTNFNVDHLHAEHQTLYLVRAGDIRSIEEASYTLREYHDFWILGATQHDAASDDPYTAVGDRVRSKNNRIESDVKHALIPSWPTSGIGLENFEITDTDKLIVVSGWAVVQFRCMAQWSKRYHA